MKQFIFACCLLALVASIQVPQDKLQPVNDPAKNISSKFSSSSSHESSPANSSVPKTAGAHRPLSSASSHGKAPVTSNDHTTPRSYEDEPFTTDIFDWDDV